MTAWMWVALGLALAAIELATPGGFFVIFFGVSAIIVGLLQAAGVLPVAWAQWLAFSALALVALRLFRQPLLARVQPKSEHVVDSLVGDVAVPSTPLAPDGRGRAEVRGAQWTVHNVGPRAVDAHARCRVVAVNGLELDIEPE
jgi:membrane protein implicated in regulation of membrane protease activity